MHDQPSPAASHGPIIRAVHVISSGWAEQHPEHRYGSKLPQLWWVLMSRRWVKLPLNYFVIDHRDGPVLFDTGLDPAIATDPTYIRQWIGRFLLRRIFRLHITPADALDHKLADAGIDPTDIRRAVISHLHFDHVGGIGHIPQAELLVSAAEWSILSEPQPEREWILREHIEIPGANWTPFAFQPSTDPLFSDFEGIYDVMGDGSMICLPTPGRTNGSISMLIRRDGWAPILLVADLVYEAARLDTGSTPGTGDRETLLASYAKVRALKSKLPDMVIVPAHDFGAEAALARACGTTHDT